jgi:uncharacterized membrane protein
MKRLTFENNTAQKIYDDYFKRATKYVNVLSPDDRSDILMELNSHIYEATHQTSAKNEVDTLVDTLESLGDPSEILKPQVAFRKARQAGRSFNPKHIFQALYLNLYNGGAYLLIAALYLLTVSFALLVIIKMIAPEHTGLFLNNGHPFAYGYTSANTSGLSELLGYWFIPMNAAFATLLYLLTTLIFRLRKKL